MRWLLGTILLLLFSLVFRLSVVTYAAYALLGVMIVSRLLSKAWIENLLVEQEFNRLTAEVGETIAVVATIRNRGPLPIVWFLAEDLLPRSAMIYDPPNLRVQGKRLHLAMLRPFGRTTMYYQLTCHRRGYFQIGPLILETGDLFGLHRRHKVATDPHFLLVYPPQTPLEGYDIASRRPNGDVRMQHRLYEDPTRISGIRQYQPGDALNRIHWRATARTGTLQSKVFDASSIAGGTIVLDFHKQTHDPKHEPYRSELAVIAAAAIAHAIYEMGQQVGLISNARDAVDRIRMEGWDYDLRSRAAARRSAGMRDESDRLAPIHIPTRRGPEQLLEILRLLARAELTDGLDFPALLTETQHRLPRDATVFAILPQVSPATAAALVGLRERGYCVNAILNVYEDQLFSEFAEPLIASGIGVKHLRSEKEVPILCREFMVGA
jgi:uncharacterized protein (DUF58 family)